MNSEKSVYGLCLIEGKNGLSLSSLCSTNTTRQHKQMTNNDPTLQATTKTTTETTTRSFEEVINECVANPPVYIGKSKRHGRGVFASRDIAKGDAVCYYDGIDRMDQENISIDEHCYSLPHLPSWLPPQISAMTRVGYRVPRTAYGCGQILNDSCFPDLQALVDSETSQIKLHDAYECMQVYKRRSLAAAMICVDLRSNAAPMWFFASRDIRKGEEIVTTYGEEYWSVELRRNPPTLTVPLVISLFYELDFYQKLCREEVNEAEIEVVLQRYGLKSVVDRGWKFSRWEEVKVDYSGTPLTRARFLNEMVRHTVIDQ